ncbi:MAG: ParA family protein [Gammaproteobacteria bacterium]|nr:ParA family protein [Gammaproteobacteria bacterium]MCW8923624.1 ParA family protein [Gammaproteobacteria bacterium]
MRTIAVINQKGGVGKTTTTANLAHAFAIKGHSVTGIDMDPQGHLAAHWGRYQKDAQGVDRVLQGEKAIAEVVVSARDNLQLVPAGRDLKSVERGESGELSPGQLKDALTSVADTQDFIFIDCPPASGLLIDYALTAADEMIIPVAADYLALRGLSDIMETVGKFEQQLDKKFKLWVVVTRFHTRRKLSWEVRNKLLEYFPDNMLATSIREATVLAECPSFGKTAFEYKGANFGAYDYASLARDLLNGECYRGQE